MKVTRSESMDTYFYRSEDILDRAIGTDSYFGIKSILTSTEAFCVVRQLTRAEIIDIMTALEYTAEKMKSVGMRDGFDTRLKELFDLLSESDVYIGKVRE